MLLTALRKVSGAFGGSIDMTNLPAIDDLGHEPRFAPRHETDIPAKMCVMGREKDCVIRTLSTRGMTLARAAVDLCVGVQVLVTCDPVPTLCGTVRWFRGDTCGVELLKPLSLDQVDKMRQAVPAGMQPRAGRARVKLPATARFADQSRQIEVLNLSVGGLMMRSVMAPKPGQRLMIEFPELLPMGGHVRWAESGACGVMFSKLLPVRAAQELATRARLGEGWLDELRMVHLNRAGFAGGSDS